MARGDHCDYVVEHSLAHCGDGFLFIQRTLILLSSLNMRVLNYFQRPLMALMTSSIMAQSVIDLSTKQWTVSSPVYNISVPGRVPSQVHLDLFREGMIPDPYVGLGDFELRWVTYSNWTYEAALDGL
jgi:beta-mannosidase